MTIMIYDPMTDPRDEVIKRFLIAHPKMAIVDASTRLGVPAVSVSRVLKAMRGSGVVYPDCPCGREFHHRGGCRGIKHRSYEGRRKVREPAVRITATPPAPVAKSSTFIRPLTRAELMSGRASSGARGAVSMVRSY